MPYLRILFRYLERRAFPYLVLLQMLCSARGDDKNDFSSLENRALFLSERLNAHESLISEILSRPDPQPREPRSTSSKSVTPIPEVIEPVPPSGRIPKGRLPVSRYGKSDTSEKKQVFNASTPPIDFKSGESDVSLHIDGYYLGIVGGSVMPLDGEVRWIGGTGGASMQFENGFLAGILVGHDFGFIRVEAEYDAIFYDQKNGTGMAEVHPVQFRCIFEKEIASRIDLRAGFGTGVALAQLDYAGKTFGGVSFCYDFLLGTGIRFSESLGLNLDYRYFLTAASDDYRRLQSNLFIASLQFDL